MAENKQLVVYAAAYETVDAALADLDAIEQLHKDEVTGQYDAAVIDQDNGKPTWSSGWTGRTSVSSLSGSGWDAAAQGTARGGWGANR